MSNDSTLSRTLHDVGLAAWFGGALMGAIGVNGAAATIGGSEGARVAERGWSRWAPFQFAAVGAHVVGGFGSARSNRGRVGRQAGVAPLTAAKAAVTVAAIGATAYAAWLGQQTSSDLEAPVPPEDALEAAAGEQLVDEAHRHLAVLQWTVPALTGALIVLGAHAGSQQHRQNVVRGVVERLT